MNNRWRVLSGVGLFVLIALLALPAVTLAHGDLARADPAPDSVLKQAPDRVIIWFTEPVELSFSEIRVLSRQGRQVDNGNTTRYQNDPTAISVTLPDLPDGTYIVAWKNLSSVDGHYFSGGFIFSIGEAPSDEPYWVAPPSTAVPEQPVLQSPAEPVLRWLELLSILAIVGCLVFELFISWPILPMAASDGVARLMAERLNYRTFKFIWLAAGIFFTASMGELLIRTSAAHGIPLFQALGRPMVSFLLTGWSNIWFWRVSALLGMITILLLASLDRRKHRTSDRREWQIVTLPFAAGILLTLSLASHGAAVTEIRAAAVFSDYLHLLAASIWIGGIAYLAVVFIPVLKSQWRWKRGRRRQSSDVLPPAYYKMAISRFSILAILSVGTLFITGLYGSWAQVSVLPALATPYGVALITKLGLIVPLLILGAVNLLWVRPRLAQGRRALQLLRKVVTAEAILAILVLLSVGIMVSLEPARQVAVRQGIGQQERLTIKETTESVRITVEVEPNRVGINRFVVSLADRRGVPVSNAQVSLLFRFLDTDLGEIPSPALSAGQGKYIVEDVLLSAAGDWRVEILAIRPDSFDTRVSFPFEILPEGTNITAAMSPSSGTGNLFWGVELLLLGFLFGGVGLYVGGRRTHPSLVAMVCSGIVILSGVILVLVSLPG